MADAKISQLPVATTPLAGTELVPVVQGGTTDQTTVEAILTGTVPSGTANGVLYLNASKVVTSGSALTFDGTILGNALTANATYSELLRLRNNGVGDNTGAKLSFNFAGTERGYVGTLFNSGWITEISGTDITRFLLGGSEQMRLTSTGLGIGTSSPAYKLDVNGTARILNGSTAFIVDSFGAVQAPGGVYVNTSGTRESGINSTGSDIRFRAGNADDRMILDSSGNLGLGVTPSAWLSSFKAVQVGTAAVSQIANRAYLTANWFSNGSGTDTYIATDFATMYRQQNGGHEWLTAPSGTAGNPITFTQAMTLDASGRLLIGTTSNLSGEPLQIDGNGVGSTVYTALIRNTSTSTSVYNMVRWGQNATGSAVGYIGTGGSTVGNPAFQNTFVVGTQTSNALVFNTNDAERARITSGGNFYVGTSSPPTDGRIVSDGADTYYAGTFTQASAAATCIAAHNRGTSGDNAFVIFLTDGGSGTSRGSIDYDRAGGLVRYNTTSDYRAKDIIGPVQNPGATIDSLKVYEGVMKGATRSRPMLVAHEAQEHAPYAVSGVKDEVNEDGTPKFQQMDVSSLVPLLLAEIQSLRARLAAAGI